MSEGLQELRFGSTWLLRCDRDSDWWQRKYPCDWDYERPKTVLLDPAATGKLAVHTKPLVSSTEAPILRMDWFDSTLIRHVLNVPAVVGKLHSLRVKSPPKDLNRRP